MSEFDPNAVERLIQCESDGCMYVAGHMDERDQKYVRAESYDALLELYNQVCDKLAQPCP